MEPEIRTEDRKKGKANVVLIVIILLLVICVAGMGAFILTRPAAAPETADNHAGEENPKLQYAGSGVTAIDEDSLNKAVRDLLDDMKDNEMALYFKNDAYSEDGTAFTCCLGNSKANKYDSYYTLYADEDFTDMIFLSGLLRPGEAFEAIELTHPLEKGTTTVYCAQTLVDEEQTMKNQFLFTLQFHVS